MNGINELIALNMAGRIKRNIGIKGIIITRAIREPYSVKSTA